MHLVCIGVTKKLMLLWAKGAKPSLLTDAVKEVSQRLVDLRSYCFVELARLPRPLKELGFWKATELRSFLLYLVPVVLKGILKKGNMNTFLFCMLQ